MNSKSLKIDLPKNYWEVSKLYPFKIKRSFDHYYNRNSVTYKTFFNEDLAIIFHLQKLEGHHTLADIGPATLKLIEEEGKNYKKNSEAILKTIRNKLKKYEKSHAEYFV